MPLDPGTRLGNYEILALVGSGGMGEVYRARDVKLGREVALKLLPPLFTRDPERLVRFRREAQVLAALNHPHIAQIHGLEEADGREFLILELVDGETLARRIERGALALDEALPIAKQIGDALAAAHEKGIIHRDLKPANVALTADGQVKVLDFGLAKALEPDPALSSPGVSAPPTITSPAMTALGMILGTAAYMAPEQAKGRGADKRSDIWAFGCVLYEMLTGRRAFDGDDVSDTLAGILRGEPDWNALPAGLPPVVRTVLAKCLAKDPHQRFADVSTPLFLLTEMPRDVGAPPPITSTHPRRRGQMLTLIAAVAIAASVVTAVVGWLLWPVAPRPIVTRFASPLAADEAFTNMGRQEIAISRDGSRIAYVANGRVNIRSMGDPRPRILGGVINGQFVTSPVFSPDGESIVYFTNLDGGALQRMAVTGGSAVTLCAMTTNPFGMTWDGDAILVGEGAGGVVRVSPNGGQPQRIIEAKTGERIYGPQMLPDGDHVLFTITDASGQTAWDTARIVVQSLETGVRTTLVSGAGDGRYVRTGHLLYAISGVVMAERFDVKKLAVAGAAAPVLEGVRRGGATTGAAQFAVSDTGTVAYLAGPASTGRADRDVAIVDTDGHRQPITPPLPANTYDHPRVSPDGRWLAIGQDDGNDADVWICDLTGGTAPRRLTFGGRNVAPVWSSDGRRVLFQSNREGDDAVFWQPADGSGVAERLTRPDKGASHTPEAVSPDGKWLLLTVAKPGTSTLATLSLADRTLSPFGDAHSGGNSRLTATFSPNGRFIAYDGESGVFVQPFPATGAKYLVIERAIHPFWSPDGTALFVGQRYGSLRIPVTTTPSVTFGTAAGIAAKWIGRGPTAERDVDIMPDGKRFVGMIEAGAATNAGGAPNPDHVDVIVNWFEELKAKTRSE